MKNQDLTRAQKKKLVIQAMLIMLVNFVLMFCVWIKTEQHQTDPALIYIIVLVFFNVLVSRFFGRI